MRAVVVSEFGPIENAVVGEMPTPVLRPDEVLVAVHATAANYADVLLVGGKYQTRPDRPFVPGTNPVGVVSQLGAEVTDFSVGDRVLALIDRGGFAEYASAPAAQCVRLPDTMRFVDAAAMLFVYETAWFALRDRARLAPGETVLVLGASGGVGLAAVQLAKAMGARVLAGVVSADKHELVREAGADAVIDLSAPDLRDSLRDQVFAATDRHGADIVLDQLGGDIFDAAMRALAWRGRMVVVGFAAGGIPTIKANYLLVKNIEVSGLQILDYRVRMREQIKACFAEVFAFHQAGRIKPGPVEAHPLEDVQTVLRAIRDRAGRGRLVLTVR